MNTYTIYGYPKFKCLRPRTETVTSPDEAEAFRAQLRADGYIVRVYKRVPEDMDGRRKIKK